MKEDSSCNQHSLQKKIDMAVSKLKVEIKGETYYLDKVPDESSAVVKAEEEKLLGAINLKTLVDDLGRVGAFIRIELELLVLNLLIIKLKFNVSAMM